MAEVRGGARLDVSGVIAAPTAAELRRTCDALVAIDAITSLTLDLRRVSRAHSDGIAALLHVENVARRNGVAVRFANTPIDVRTMLRLAGLTDPELFA